VLSVWLDGRGGAMEKLSVKIYIFLQASSVVVCICKMPDIKFVIVFSP
jgi:hypothetical protein